MSGVARLLVALLLAGLAAPSAHAADDEVAASVFVERADVPDAVYPGQVLDSVLRIGVDRERFDAHAAPLFRQATDLPLQVSGLGAVEGLEALEGDDAVRLEGATLVLDGAIVSAVKGPNVTRDGRTYETYALRRRLLVTAAPGAIALPAPTLRLAWAQRFEEDFLGERVPLDPRFVTVSAAPATLTVRALPSPPTRPRFLGAVGRFTLEAQLDREAVDVGERFTLTLRFRVDLVRGGNLRRFEAPRLDALAGYHVYGVQDDRGYPMRTIRYELAAQRAGLRGVPPVAFCFFDPAAQPPGYVTLRSEALPLHVADSEDRSAGAAAPRLEVPRTVVAEPAGQRPPWLWMAGALGLAIGLALGWRARRARERAVAARSSVQDGAHRRLALAEAVLGTALGSPEGARGGMLDRAFAEWVGARLDCSRAAVLAPDLARRLEVAGVPAAAAADAQRVLERLVAARYGAPALGLADVERARAVFEALRESLARGRA